MAATTFPETSRDRTRELIREWQEGGNTAFQARDEIVRLNMGLVTSISNRHLARVRHLVERDDLDQAGTIGLLKAIDRFDLDRNTRFSTYAIPWIRSAITHECINHANLIHIPCHILEARTAMKTKRVVSPDRMIQANNAAKLDGPKVELLPAPESLWDTIGSIDRKDAIRRHLGILTDRQRKMVEMRFGLNGHPESILEEIAVEIGINREHVRIIIADCLKKLARESKRRNDSLLSLIV